MGRDPAVEVDGERLQRLFPPRAADSHVRGAEFLHVPDGQVKDLEGGLLGGEPGLSLSLALTAAGLADGTHASSCGLVTPGSCSATLSAVHDQQCLTSQRWCWFELGGQRSSDLA